YPISSERSIGTMRKQYQSRFQSRFIKNNKIGRVRINSARLPKANAKKLPATTGWRCTSVKYNAPACPTMPKPWLKSHAPPFPKFVQVQVPKTGNKASIIRLGRFISSTLPNMKKEKTHIPAI